MKDASDMYIPTLPHMLVAHDPITPYTHRTPVLTSSFLNELTGAQLFFKCENCQNAAAFKVRGASNAVFGLTDATLSQATLVKKSGSSCNQALLANRPS